MIYELRLPAACIAECTGPGSADSAVAFWHSRPYVARQLAKIPDSVLRRELSEYGAWDAEALEDRTANEQRIVWVSSCQIREEQQADRTYPRVAYIEG